MANIGPMAINRNHDETDEGNDERQVDGRKSKEFNARVDDECLDGREYRATKNGHDKTCTSKFHVVANTSQGNAIDGGEHQ